MFANEHFVDVGGRAGAKQEVELFSFKNGALEIVSRAPDGTQMQLFCTFCARTHCAATQACVVYCSRL